MTGQPPDIESSSNSRVKSWTALAKRSERERTGRFLIEGQREVFRAQNHLVIDEIIWCPDYGGIHVLGDVPSIISVSRRAFDKISRRQNPDGIVAVARIPDVSFDAFDPPSPEFVLVADGVEKPGNIGAILRTCDAFGASFLGSDLGTDLFNPNVVRSAQGSLYTTPVASVQRTEAIAWCRESTSIIVAHPGGESTPWQADLKGPVSIVIGAEHSGVHQKWLDVGISVSLPMAGTADSLNASVTAGIFLAEAVRQRSS